MNTIKKLLYGILENKNYNRIFSSFYVKTSTPPLQKILDEREICDLECLSLSIFSPISTYMSRRQFETCLHNMKVDDNIFPIPITCSVSSFIEKGKVIQLRSNKGVIHAELTVEECWSIDLEKECTLVFGCFDKNHPYIAYQLSKKDSFYVSGSIKYKPVPYHLSFIDNRLTPDQVKLWRGNLPLIGFQTRNPLHCSHIELIKNSLTKVPDAKILLHPVEGVTQECDIPFSVRMRCYKSVVPYLSNCNLGILPLSMRMAGPREAVWHAIIRRNYGCTHFIVGRDHAGPSYKKSDGTRFYDEMAAQKLAISVESAIGIKILASDEVVYCEDTKEYMELHKTKDLTIKTISGTQFRKMLETGSDIPNWYSYPDVITFLKQYYQKPRGVCYYFVGISGSGKSTLAEILCAKLEELHPTRAVTLLDADIIRSHISKGLGFSKEDRSTNVRRIGYVASEIVKHGGIVVVANIAPFDEDRVFNRNLIQKYGEYNQIFMNIPLEECSRRDVKGLYSDSKLGVVKNLTGVSDPFEIPTDSSLDIGLMSLDDMKNLLFKHFNL
uniref:adenylyl-sulfate kinase n=1 Tax=viral metagenome TaxID=1070528 RepID=A0A6C0D100_9ZZZZ